MGENMSNWTEQFKKCNDNRLCISEVDAKARGTWFFMIDVLTEGGTIKGSFEVFSFAPTLPELESDERIDTNEPEPPELYGVLNRIHHSEAMAFVKMQDSFSGQLTSAFAKKGSKAFDKFRFTLRRFSRNGGLLYEFSLDMKSIFILDIKKAGAGEKVLITYGKTQLGASLPPGETEISKTFGTNQ
jgi:hypothetical protein